jgi:hypothetical protein
MVSAQIEATLTVTALQNVNVRAEPSSTSEKVGALANGESAELIGRTISGELMEYTRLWYRVRLSNDIEGWVFSRYVTTGYETLNGMSTVSQADLRENFPDTITVNRRFGNDRTTFFEDDEPITVELDWEHLAQLVDIDGNPLDFGVYVSSVPPVAPEITKWGEAGYIVGVITDIAHDPTWTEQPPRYFVTLSFPVMATNNWATIHVMMQSVASITAIDNTGAYIGLPPEAGDVLWLELGIENGDSAITIQFDAEERQFISPTAQDPIALRVGDPVIAIISVYGTVDPSNELYSNFSEGRTSIEWLVDLTDNKPRNDRQVLTLIRSFTTIYNTIQTP